MKNLYVYLFVLALIGSIAIAHDSAAWVVHQPGVSNIQPVWTSSPYAYNPHHLQQPRHPVAWQSPRPSGYGLVQQGPAYSPRAVVYEDPRFVGHQVHWGSPVRYSAITGQPRVPPQQRVMSQERYVPLNAQRYTPQNTNRLPTLWERQNTWYGTWSRHP